jgi:uncharacterized protein (DUF1697 family)
MVALLRGVNVGGKAKLAMADLRRVAEELGYDDVATYVQSGNLVFACRARTTAPVARRVQKALADATGLDIEVIVRTRDELREVVAANPFLDRTDEYKQLHVVFGAAAAKPSLQGLDAAKYAPEEAAAVGRELYLYLPSGIGRSKLAADLARKAGPTGTARNWRTVTTLLEMAEERA